MNGQATLSVLMPNYNHARFLAQSLGAILGQSRQPEAIIVIDDASTDESLEVLREHASRHPNFRIVANERNLGVVANLNRMVDMCQTSHAVFLAADDMILSGLFEKSLRLLEQYPMAGLCSALVRRMGYDGEDLGSLAIPIILDSPGYVPPREALDFLMRDGEWIMNNTSVYRMDALRAGGGFRPELQAFCDGFLSDVVALREGACYIPEELACWREDPRRYSSASTRDLEVITKIIRRVLELMKTEYSDVFDEACRENFRKNLCKRHNSEIRSEDLVV